MPRRREPDCPRVVYRTARAGLRLTKARRRRLLALLVAAGDVWACVLELTAGRRPGQDRPLACYPELCRELAASGPGTFGELDSTGARSVLRRYADAWFAAAKRRRDGDGAARFPRRRRRMVPVRWYHGTFRLDGRMLQVPVARGCPPLRVRLDRDLPYPAGQVRSVTLLFGAGPPRALVGPPAGGRTRRPPRGWGVGPLIRVVAKRAGVAGIPATVGEGGGPSPPSPACTKRVPKPAGRVFTCPHCQFHGHRD